MEEPWEQSEELPVVAAAVLAAVDTVVDCIVVVAAVAEVLAEALAEALVQLALVAERIAAAEPVEAFAERPAVVEDETAVVGLAVPEVVADTVDGELVAVASDCRRAAAVAFVAEAALPNRELRGCYCCST